ncbi:hypothetical protein QJQ45_005797 [Haematococcus lacustris]|nr:hypothetical protein QJQ45_005797 [Haematococcus lacustris]
MRLSKRIVAQSDAQLLDSCRTGGRRPASPAPVPAQNATRMSTLHDVCPETDRLKEEIATVREKIVEVETKTVGVEEEIVTVRAKVVNDPSSQPLKVLEDHLRKEEELLLKKDNILQEELAGLCKKEELLRKKEELMRKELVELRKKENLLLGRAVRQPRQVDALSHVRNMRSMFATVRVINDRTDPPIELQAEVLVDSGCSPELILPKRKTQQLQLAVMDTTTARGYGGAYTEMIVYRAVKVEVDLTDALTGEVLETKSTDLIPQSKSSDPDWVPSDDRLHEFAGFRGQPVDGGVVKLSPVKRSSDKHDPPGLLGFAGLQKLKLQVDPEKYYLMRVTESEPIV